MWFYQWYYTKSCANIYLYIYIYLYIIYIYAYVLLCCLCFKFMVLLDFLIWLGLQIPPSDFNGPPFQVTSLAAQSRPWPRRSRDRRKRPRKPQAVKAPRLPVIEQLGFEIHPGVRSYTPRKLLTVDTVPARLRNRTWSHGGLVQMIFRTSRGIFSGSMLLFRGVSKNGRMRLKPEIRCFTSFYILCIILWYPFFVDFNCVDYPYGRNGTMQIYGKFGGFWGIALQDAWFGLVIITTAVDFVHIRTILTCRDRLFHG